MTEEMKRLTRIIVLTNFPAQSSVLIKLINKVHVIKKSKK